MCFFFLHERHNVHSYRFYLSNTEMCFLVKLYEKWLSKQKKKKKKHMRKEMS